MKRRSASCFFTIAAAFVLVFASNILAKDDDGISHSFNLTIDSQVVMDVQGQKQPVVAHKEIVYAWQKKGLDQTLRLSKLATKSSISGQEQMNVTMERARLINTQQGQPTETKFEDAPDALKRILQDSFESPLCVLHMDEAGAEVKRTVVAGPGAKDTIDSGMIANTTLFHSPFFSDRDQWDAQKQISVGNGAYVDGKLNYKKVAGSAVSTVKISGTLTNKGFKIPNSPVTMKAAVYAVSGEETYDPADHDWKSGKMKIDISYDMWVDGKSIGTSEGVMNLTFARVPDTKK